MRERERESPNRWIFASIESNSLTAPAIRKNLTQSDSQQNAINQKWGRKSEVVVAIVAYNSLAKPKQSDKKTKRKWGQAGEGGKTSIVSSRLMESRIDDIESMSLTYIFTP